jgi:hypothetical protein
LLRRPIQLTTDLDRHPALREAASGQVSSGSKAKAMAGEDYLLQMISPASIERQWVTVLA